MQWVAFCQGQNKLSIRESNNRSGGQGSAPNMEPATGVATLLCNIPLHNIFKDSGLPIYKIITNCLFDVIGQSKNLLRLTICPSSIPLANMDFTASRWTIATPITLT